MRVVVVDPGANKIDSTLFKAVGVGEIAGGGVIVGAGGVGDAGLGVKNGADKAGSNVELQAVVKIKSERGITAVIQ